MDAGRMPLDLHSRGRWGQRKLRSGTALLPREGRIEGRMLMPQMQTFASFINGTINFNYPATAGWSFSFTSTGYFEQSQCKCVDRCFEL